MFRLSDLNWPRILHTRTAAILLGISAVLTVPALIFIHTNFDPGAYSSAKGDLLNILAGLSAFGLIALLICMAFFWLRCDVSSRLSRTIWFVVLLLGFAYGSQIAYYALVYLPAVIKRLRNPETREFQAPPLSQDEDRGRIGPFRRPLLFAWGIIAVLTLAIVIAPASLSHFSPFVAVPFFFCSAIVALESVIYRFVSIFRSGMARPPEHEGHTIQPRNKKQK